MKSDPRVQQFLDEAAAARKELRKLATDIAAYRFDHGAHPMHTVVLPEIQWAMEHGRTDIAARIIEMVDQYNNASASAQMMTARVSSEAHEKAIRARDDGDVPDYFAAGEEETQVLRLSPEEAQTVFSTVNSDEE